MERKIGEIFEVDGQWYQCVEANENDNCNACGLQGLCIRMKAKKHVGNCMNWRTDNKRTVFKKLEKVGEPYTVFGRTFQSYKMAKILPPVWNVDFLMCPHLEEGIINIEIKQNKEDMEEKKLIELLSEKVHNAWMKEKEAQGFSYGKDYDKEKKKHPDMLPYNELKEEVKEYDRATVRAVLQAQKELQSKYNYNNLKSFDIEAAKLGKPVCTRDGRKARIICFDRNDLYPIVALIECEDGKEMIGAYSKEGQTEIYEIKGTDLMMLPEKKEGWVNVYKHNLYDTESEAKRAHVKEGYIDTIKIEWEE